MTWNNVPAILAIVLPLSGVVLTISLKVIYNKKKEVLPCCAERFKNIDAELNEMKKRSTDRESIIKSVQSAMELLTKSNDDNHRNYKELSKAVNETAKEVAVIGTNIKYMAMAIDEIKINIEKNKKEQNHDEYKK